MLVVWLVFPRIQRDQKPREWALSIVWKVPGSQVKMPRKKSQGDWQNFFVTSLVTGITQAEGSHSVFEESHRSSKKNGAFSYIKRNCCKMSETSGWHRRMARPDARLLWHKEGFFRRPTATIFLFRLGIGILISSSWKGMNYYFWAYPPWWEYSFFIGINKNMAF